MDIGLMSIIVIIQAVSRVDGSEPPLSPPPDALWCQGTPADACRPLHAPMKRPIEGSTHAYKHWLTHDLTWPLTTHDSLLLVHLPTSGWWRPTASDPCSALAFPVDSLHLMMIFIAFITQYKSNHFQVFPPSFPSNTPDAQVTHRQQVLSSTVTVKTKEQWQTHFCIVRDFEIVKDEMRQWLEEHKKNVLIEQKMF